jgi:sugar transferase (PEP-CTERM/EpsH1 system associated)
MAGSPPKILLLTHRIPFPPNRGDRIRAYHLIEFLSKHAQLYLGSVSDEPWDSSQRSALEKNCHSVFFARLKSPTRWLRAAAGFSIGKSVTQGAFYSPLLASQLTRWSSEIQFDAAVIYCSSMGSYTQALVKKPKRLLVDLVDVDSQKWSDYAAVSGGLKKWVFRQEARRVCLLEDSIAKQADALTVVSPDEAALFERIHPNLRAIPIGNGVDHQFFAPSCPSAYESIDEIRRLVNLQDYPRLVFVGVLDYLPNIQGLQWFCRQVLPGLQRVFPNTKLDIVGRRPSSEVLSLAAIPGVRLIGEVPDVRPYVLEAHIAIAPLQIARGVQNKVLEALACAKPVVATSHAATGIECVGGLAVANGPDEWVRTISELQNPEYYVTMSQQARVGILERNSWSAKLGPLLPLLGIS